MTTANQENPNTCDIRIGTDNRIGEYPRIPVRFLLQREFQKALGYTPFDLNMVARRKDGDPTIEPSGKGDEFALPLVYFAAVGTCWPEDIRPNLRECRHDVVAYGEIVYEHFFKAHGVGVLADARSEGFRLIVDMLKAATSDISEAIKTEADFT